MPTAYSLLVSISNFVGHISMAMTRIRTSPTSIWALASISLFIDTFVYTLTVSMLPDILQTQMGASESANGIVTTMFGVGSVVGSICVGILSDRIQERRWIQIAGAIIYSISGIIFYFARHYYQILVFRLVDGVASGLACTLLYASIGDVYPANLLSFKVSIVYFANNIAYTIGPVCGQRLFDLAGVKGPAAVVIALGLFKLALLWTFAKDSLSIRSRVHPNAYTAAVDSSWDACSNSSKVETTYHVVQNSISIPKLLLRLPVVVSTMAIVTSIGIQCMLEGLVPLHLAEKLNRHHDGGITFVILGLVFTTMVPIVGHITDRLIEWRGETMRYYVMMFGSLATIAAAILMAFAKSFAVLMVGYSFFAVADLCMFIPAQSAYGDFVNGENVNSMARGYSIATVAWALGAISLPPIGSALYSQHGFSGPVIGIAAIPCSLCAVACLAFILRKN